MKLFQRKMLMIFVLIFMTSFLLSCNVYSEETSESKKKNDYVVSENIKVHTSPIIENIPVPVENKIENKNEEVPIVVEEKVDEPAYLEVKQSDISLLTYSLFKNDVKLNEHPENSDEIFPTVYTEIPGVLTFRGNHLRTSPSYGEREVKEGVLQTKWSFTTSSRSWGGGAGWTGQPSIVKWPNEIKQIMNIKGEFKKDPDFIEVIYASLDGRVYFLDFKTGKKTREPIDIKNPIKGSVSVDPRGYPILYVGQGIPEQGKIGYRIYSLIDGSLLYFLDGKDKQALRGWYAFDGAPLINRETDTMLLGGENGLFYNIKLNTKFDLQKKTVSIQPEVMRYQYKIKGNNSLGIENSVAAYKNLVYFADNGGGIQAIDLLTMKPVWVFPKSDDTDATIVLDIEDGKPYLYTGTEVDKQGKNGYSYLRKIDGLTGEIIWEKKYKCFYVGGEKPVNGGLLATPALGKGDTEGMIFFTLARYEKLGAGLMLALDKNTGEEIWTWEMPHYAWSSPLDFYDQNGKTYLLQADSVGTVHLIEGKNGKIMNKLNLGANIEASPSMYNDTAVVATRGGKIFAFTVK